MEFHEKLLQLRKQKGMTQEQLAEALFVSRTAVSKWESGKGYPNIDSLKCISRLFVVSIDELLSGEELISLADSENRSNARKRDGLLYGILDVMVIGMFVLPLFGQREGEHFITVPLTVLRDVTSDMRIVYYSGLLLLIAIGIAELLIHLLHKDKAQETMKIISLISHSIVILFFVLTRQPYATAFLFMLFIVKIVNTFAQSRRRQ